MNTVTIHQPPQRGAYEIVRDFTAAAEHLTTIAADWRQFQFRTNDLVTADNTLAGLRALLAELRVTSNPSKED
jgi:hypothetical protein